MSRRWRGPPLGGQVVEPISGLDGLTEGEVAGQDDVFPLQRDDEDALHGPGTDPGYRGELSHELVVRQTAQDVDVQSTVRQPLGEVAECADLPPGQSRLAEPSGSTASSSVGVGRCPSNRASMRASVRRVAGDGQLLTGDLEQQCAVQIHRRKQSDPRPGIEVRPVVDEPREHRIGVAKVGPRRCRPRGAAGIHGHRACHCSLADMRGTSTWSYGSRPASSAGRAPATDRSCSIPAADPGTAMRCCHVDDPLQETFP